MGQIINKTQEFYPTLPGAAYLVYEGEDVPSGVTIAKSNVIVVSGGELKVRPAKYDYGKNWGWSTEHGFYNNFSSPEEAISGYHKFMNNLKNIKNKK